MSNPGIVIAGTHSGCGKTTVSTGIMAALVKRGTKLQPFKAGPDYIDPMFHSFITGCRSLNLDSWLLGEDTLKYLYRKNSRNAGLCIVEGMMGLFDGYDTHSIQGSTAHIARILSLPVVLVVDSRGMALSIAALIKGFRDFEKDIRICGIILNQIYNKEHYQYLKDCIEENTNIPVMGYLPGMKDVALAERHLGLVASDEVEGLQQKLEVLSRQVESTIDLDRLLQMAHSAETPEANCPCTLPGSGECSHKVRIAVARDQAFNFYYEDNLELLEALGAEIIPFSPIKDRHLPEGISGIYLGGGYPEVWGRELESNHSIQAELREKIGEGIPTYAECGGLMYLCQSIENSKGEVFRMTGVLPGISRMTSSLQHFGYVEIQAVEDNILSTRGNTIRGHEFHFSEVSMTEEVPRCLKVVRGTGVKKEVWLCGYRKENVLANYAHLHFWSNPDFAQRFIEQCTAYAGKRGEADR